MIYEIKETQKVEKLFEGWEETLIYSCLQKVMGKIYVTEQENPKSACAQIGCFCFFAGEPDKELVLNKPDGFVIMTPQNEEWNYLIEECYPEANKVKRYAVKKDTVFDKEKLQAMTGAIPEGYELCQIDEEIYDKCLLNPLTQDFVAAFDSKESYLKMGFGKVMLKDGEVVAGASSYTRYEQGIEIEVDTVGSERRKHLATACCASLILECLERGLYPSWDAQNMNSVRLSEKLGYEFSHEYTAYEVF